MRDVYVFGSGGKGGEGGEWMRRLDLSFTNPVGTEEVWTLCLCLCCGGVCGEWVGGLTRVWRGGVVLCLCESEFFV